MDYAKTTGNTIAQAFRKFDNDNPVIYQKFKKRVLEAISLGKKKTSAKLIINVIRWEKYLETKTDDIYRINDAFTAHYARKFLREFESQGKYQDIFELRALRATVFQETLFE